MAVAAKFLMTLYNSLYVAVLDLTIVGTKMPPKRSASMRSTASSSNATTAMTAGRKRGRPPGQSTSQSPAKKSKVRKLI